MYLPALRASVVIWLAGFLAACSGGTEQATANPNLAEAAEVEAPAQDIAAEPEPEADPIDPTISFSATDSSVNSGGTTTLNWNSEGTDSCTASGGWSGGKASNGSEATAPITANTTFPLNCSGPGGNVVAMIEVTANGELSISWQAPTENVDGSPLTDLSGYTIYYGQNPGDYTEQVDVNNANATNYSVTLAAGEYYVAMTALDLEGNESALSNEVIKATL